MSYFLVLFSIFLTSWSSLRTGDEKHENVVQTSYPDELSINEKPDDIK